MKPREKKMPGKGRRLGGKLPAPSNGPSTVNAADNLNAATDVKLPRRTICTLIADTRERNVLRHQRELEEINFEVKQITTADYVVTYRGKIVAAIERKSLEDYAASIKDGRADNKKKLIELRGKTGCALIYIIEGDPFPHPGSCYGNIPYRYIESSIFHLMVRDNITTIRTKDTLGTAEMLVRFVKSMDTLAEKKGFPCADSAGSLTPDSMLAKIPVEPTEFTEPTNGAVENFDIDAELTRRHIRSDHDVVRELWSCFPGISVETADEYSARWTIADIVCEVVPRGEIQAFKMASGRSISKKVVNSLTGIPNHIEVRLLSCIDGISTATAKELTSDKSLKALLKYGVAGISMCKIGKNKKSFGEERATRLLRIFNYKYAPGGATKTSQRLETQPVQEVAANKITEEDMISIGAFLDEI